MMVMKKFSYIMVMCGLCFLFAACGREEEPSTEQELLQNEIYMYYVNMDRTDVVKHAYRLKKDALLENVSDIIEQFGKTAENGEVQCPLPDRMEYVSAEFEETRSRLTVYFNIFYDEVQADSLLFFKACVAKTLLQLENVDTVAIALTDMANPDLETAVATENFDEDSFAMSFGNSNGYAQKGNLVLYFAAPGGESLKEYHKAIEISNNTSLAEVVVQSLIDGPLQEGYEATIPASTTVRNISVKDGICYVDLSDEFYDKQNPMRNDIIIYSIVNSLAELPTVSKVQFLQNGEKQPLFRETMPFDALFERNLDLIEQNNEEETNEEENNEGIEEVTEIEA